MKKIPTLLACALLAACLGVQAHEGKKHTGPVKKEQKDWGIAGDAKAAQRTITLTMTDNMRFTPDTIEVKQGEVVKLVIKNSGQLFHEMVIGTKAELDEHAALMVKFPNMEHDEPYMAHVKPGATGEMVWNFNRAGDFDFACLVAGHYQAGMAGKIKVLAAAKAGAQAQAVTPDLTDGEVRKVDKDTRKITLKHGEIKNLDMPPMTMVFQVSDPALLDKVKPGDKVRFMAGNELGKLTVTAIEVVK